MVNHGAYIHILDSRGNWLNKVGGAAALMVGILLLIGSLGLIAVDLQPASTGGWLTAFQNNWLIIIFKLHAGFSGVQLSLLNVLDYLDIAILGLVGILHLALYAALRRTGRVWSMIAAIQPFLGIVLFVATGTAGRSAVMGAVLVISLVMMRSDIFTKLAAYLGIMASALLLAGDFSAGIIPPSPIIATLFGIGYLLLITWFFLIARRLFQLAPRTSEAATP